jgi:Asp-tRNA(Asn)/Glu-tRNA(Gln) amidotransferase A subunit family amidase
MLEKSKGRRVLTAGLLAGTVMFAVGAAFHLLISRFVALPYNQPPFRPWCGWTFFYMVVHPFWFGFAFAWLFTHLEPRTQSIRTGARFGALLFLVGALPIYLVTFASIAMPWRVIVCWIIQGFIQYVLAGAALGLRGIRPRVNNAALSSGGGGPQVRPSPEGPPELDDKPDAAPMLEAAPIADPYREPIMSLKPDDLCYLSAVDLAARIRAGTVSPIEVIDALRDRISRLNPKLNAYVALDLDSARKDVEMKEKWRHEHPDIDLGPLYGVPVAIKDDLEVVRLPFTCGSLLRKDHIGKSDDLTVSRLRQAGAIILGKTNEPEFGHKGVTENRLFGTTPTPWHLERTAGGSSGGSAAAVAAGMAYLALGTDIAGSVRIPASCCGIVGLKPSFGRIPRVPSYNAFVTQWYIGPLARTVADTALALRVLAGPDDRDPFSLPALGENDLSLGGSLRDLRVIFRPRPTGVPVEDEVVYAAAKTTRLLQNQGVKVVLRNDPLPAAPRDALLGIFRAVSLADAGIKDEADFRNKRDLLTRTFAAFVEPGLKLTLRDYLSAQASVTEFLEQSAPDFWKDCDVLATPTLAVPPFSTNLPLGPERVAGVKIDPQVDWAFTWPFNLTGQPAVSIPADGRKTGCLWGCSSSVGAAPTAWYCA